MSKATWARRRLLSYLRVLRDECGTAGDLPVAVAFSRTPYNGRNGLAWCYLKRDAKGRPRSYRIVIRTTVADETYPGARRATFTELRDSLIHEWAHAMSWTENSDDRSRGDHGPEWGVAFSRAYQATRDE